MKVKMEALCREFEEFMILKNLSPRTIKTFGQIVRYFLNDYTVNHGGKPLNDDIARDYLLQFSSLRGVINSYMEENPEETCVVYAMSATKNDDKIVQTVRERRTNTNEEIQQLFQGPNPQSKNFERGELYPGDRNIRNIDKLTIQVHRLKLTGINGDDILDENEIPIYEDVPTIAIWIPETIGKDIIRQPDNRL